MTVLVLCQESVNLEQIFEKENFVGFFDLSYEVEFVIWLVEEVEAAFALVAVAAAADALNVSACL